MDRYIIMQRSAKMPVSCWGRYGKIAVVRLQDGFEGEPAMISARSRGVAEVVQIWDRLHVGTTDRCAYYKALREAEALCAELNGGES